ncbi:ABC transporter substrate-binding protein [Ammoniphilus sp. CFH 90114]|uniref:ABC transporter substrate-binding protein n=1 Tax=Ammoniphilus sp. CFH 90114 TaxID=2493665 RepID=UPI00100E5207|nr:ABC transporter substrate-binding protein [Ammoniphilus sp. CFH 90114]RXT06531.1 ABC transporter substrate-binding protein [Ammoniphilus sp. CFH 90114]
MKKVKWLSVVSSLVLAIALTGCGQNANSPQVQTPSEQKPADSAGSGETQTTESPNGKDTLVVAMTADQGTLDPGVSMDNSAWKITYPTYERLVEYDGASTEVKAGLAKEWKISDDGLTWTFILNEGHKFADGTPVDAEAVKFTFDRILKIAKGPSDVYGVISEVKVENPNTVVFVLKENFPPFLSTLAANYGGIVNPKVLDHEQNGDLGQNYLASNTAGSGAYHLTEWKKGEYFKLEQNSHSSVQPSLKTIYFRIVGDPSAQRLQLEKGEIDIAEGIPVDQIESVKAFSNVELIQQPSLAVDYLYVNTSQGNPALQNAKVRQAISYALDYQGIIDATQQGYATQMRGPIPKGLWGHDEQAMQYSYDPNKAKELLAEAGVKDLTLDFLYSDNKPFWETTALMAQANLAEVGIKLNLKKVAYATMREMIDKGEFDLCTGVWSPDFADPFMFMNYWFDSNSFGLAGNRAFYKNDEVDQMIRKAASINNIDERKNLYQQAQNIVIEDAAYIYLDQKDFLLPMSKEVKGFTYNPMLEGIYNLATMSK